MKCFDGDSAHPPSTQEILTEMRVVGCGGPCSHNITSTQEFEQYKAVRMADMGEGLGIALGAYTIVWVLMWVVIFSIGLKILMYVTRKLTMVRREVFWSDGTYRADRSTPIGNFARVLMVIAVLYFFFHYLNYGSLW